MAHSDSITCSACGRLPKLMIPESLAAPDSWHSLLHSSYEGPTPVQDEVLPFVKQEEARLSVIEQNIARLEAELRDLTNMKASTVDSLGRYRSLASPIRRLPVELLREIFVHAGNEYHARLFGANTPWVISQVCKLWHDIYTPYPREVYTKQVYLVIKPTRHDHFSVTISAPAHVERFDYGEPRFDFDLEELVPVIERSSERWKHLVVGPADTTFLQFLRPFEGCLTTIESLDINITPTGDIELSKLSRVLTFLHLPRLIRLTGNPKVLQRLPLPLAQIEHFSTRPRERWSPLAYDIWQTLHRVPNLTCSITFSKDSGYRVPSADTAPLVLTHLKSLSANVFANAHIIKHLHLPALEVCELMADEFWNLRFVEDFHAYASKGYVVQLFTQFLTRCGSGHLKTLRLLYCEPRIDYVQVLEVLLSLEYLVLDQWDDSYGLIPKIWSHMLATPTSQFLPNLKEFTVAGLCSHDYPDSQGTLARLRLARPNVQFILDYDDDYDDDYDPAFDTDTSDISSDVSSDGGYESL